MAATYATVGNATAGPLTITAAGHQLGAGDVTGAVNIDVQPAKGHVAAGRLNVLERPDGDVELDERARAAFDATERKRAEKKTTAPAKATPTSAKAPASAPDPDPEG